MELNINLLADEYSNYPFDVDGIILFHRKKEEGQTNYVTHRCALIFPIRGSAHISFDDETFIAEPGKVIHGSPGKAATFQLISQEFDHVNIYYTPFPVKTRKSNYMNIPYELRIKDFKQIEDSLNQLLKLATRPDALSKMRKKAIVLTLLEKIFTDYNLADRHYDRELIEKSIEFIHNHYMEPLTLNQLADQFGKTENQFSYLFYKYMGIRPITYLLEFRIETALNLLTTTNLSVKETAEQVGYQDPFYFSKLFKKYVGKSPRQIKKSL